MGLQKFKVERMHRSKLKQAPYNPRVLGEGEKARLKAGLKRHGIVEPLVWNKRTGTLVGGHQRLGILDSLAGTENYELDVSVIDVDEAQEKELNILLNNPQSQGNWDLDKLSAIFKDSAVQVTGTGFDQADLYRLFGDSPLVQGQADLEDYASRVDTARAGFEAAKQRVRDRDNDMFFCIVVFRDAYDMEEFVEKLQLPGSRWQSGADFRRLLGLPEYEPRMEYADTKKPKISRSSNKATEPGTT